MEKKEKTRPRLDSVWREARELIWKYRHRLALGMVLMLVSRAAGLVLPASSKFVVDEVFLNKKYHLLMPLALAVGGATIIQAITGFGLSQLLGVTAQRAISEMRRRVQRHLIKLPVSFFDSTQSGILISRVMTDAEGIRNLVGTGLVQLTGSIVTSICALAILFYLNWWLTLVTITLLAVFGIAFGAAFSRLRPVFRERNKLNAELTGRLNETLNGIRLIKAYRAERREQQVFAKGIHGLFRLVAKSVTSVSAINSLAIAVAGAAATVMMLLGGRSVIHGEMTLGDLTMFVFFSGLMASPVIQIASVGTQITEAFAGLDRIRELMGLTAEDAADLSRAPVGPLRGEVEFQDVSFAYQPDVDVIKHVSFKVPAGSTTALVGSSGSGKSTLVGLVMAFHHPREGRILVDGQDLAGLRMGDYRRQLGVVMQDNFLFDGTVADNIRFAKPQASRAEIEEAGRIAHVSEFAERFENGYDTIVGERGVRLSGGQRQRVAIARAVLANPAILILDEATSSLDSESEFRIQDALNKLRQGRTTFVIAHRLSTIRSATQILVIENGAILERGNHEELYALGGRYTELYDRQHNFEKERFVNPGEELYPAGERQPEKLSAH